MFTAFEWIPFCLNGFRSTPVQISHAILNGGGVPGGGPPPGDPPPLPSMEDGVLWDSIQIL